jgi:hypothetical protein
MRIGMVKPGTARKAALRAVFLYIYDNVVQQDSKIQHCQTNGEFGGMVIARETEVPGRNLLSATFSATNPT